MNTFCADSSTVECPAVQPGDGGSTPTSALHPNARIGQRVDKCFQATIRDRVAAECPREQIASLAEARVEEITAQQARPIILRYEWLGTMGRSVHCCGLFIRGELLGVACFGWPAGIESRDICGRENRGVAIALERGACVHYAPKNAASFLVRNAVRLISKKHGYRIFYAYSDEDAGEIGTIYQACGWVYIGQGVGRTPGRLREYFVTPEGKTVSCRVLRHRKMKKRDALLLGWQVKYQKPKHKYIWIEGNKAEKAELLGKLRYQILPYPKRQLLTA